MGEKQKRRQEQRNVVEDELHVRRVACSSQLKRQRKKNRDNLHEKKKEWRIAIGTGEVHWSKHTQWEEKHGAEEGQPHDLQIKKIQMKSYLA